MIRKLIITAAIAVVAVVAPPVAPPAEADEPDIYGDVTSDEAAEIWENGWRNCATLDKALETDPPVTSTHVKGIIESYRAEGWDLESAGDIVYESVEGGCPEYMPQVQLAMRSYPPMS
jgi:hypothetical protein